MSRPFRYVVFFCCLVFLSLLPGLIRIPSSILSAQTPQNSSPASQITSIAFQPDGKTLVSASRDSEVRLWDTSTSQQLQVFQGHEQPVRTVATSPDGNTIASGAEDTKVALWDVKSRKLRQFLSGHTGFVNKVVFSPDGSLLASGGQDDRIVLWDVTTGQLRQTLLGHADEVVGLAFSPDGKTLASGSKDTKILLWDTATGQQQQTLEGHTQSPRAIAFSADGRTLVSGGDDNLVILWNPRTGQQQQVLRQHTRPVRAVAFSPDGTTILSGSEDNQIIRWDAKTGSPLPNLPRQLQLPQGTATRRLAPIVTDIAFSADGRTIASGVGSGQIVIGDSTTGQTRQTLPTPPRPTPVSPPSSRVAPTPRARAASLLPDTGPGGPILVITSTTNPFTSYYAEILRNEGLNAFRVVDIGSVSSTILAGSDIAILGDMTLTTAQVTTLTNWVNGGGKLIAMHPDKKLATLLGLTATTTPPLADSYLLVDTSRFPGNGVVSETIQFHGSADRYTLKSGTSSLATLFSNATSATSNPALTLRNVGSSSGQAAAFTYDLARSIVYTRQGNPAWAEQERDGFAPTRSDDQYFGAAAFEPAPKPADWVNLNKVALPQADEQQRLLVNLLLRMNLSKKPLPRFWYFPRGKKAVVIMTGDDHAAGGTAERFNQYRAFSPAGCSVANWECVRSTSYIYTDTPLSNTDAATATADGFELALHPSTGCANYTPTSIAADLSTQLQTWRNKYTSLPSPVTNRVHCLVWSNWVSQAQAELNQGIRLDTAYYYWPPTWILDRPGFFTGSGMVMRFSDLDGTPIDVYQAATQMTDESAQSYPLTINALLDRAVGSEGYYGAFVVNAHTDENSSQPFGGRTNSSKDVSDAVVNAALSRNLPVVSARQMLTWLDGRHRSSLSGLSFSSNRLNFTIAPDNAAVGLQAMVPFRSNNGRLNTLTRGGSAVTFTTDVIKGVEYAFFPATAGAYVATYVQDTVAPTVSSTVPTNGATNVAANTSVNVTFNEAIDPATINVNTFTLRNPANAVVPATLSYNSATRTAVLKPNATLTASTAYTFQVRGGTADPRIKDPVGNALAANFNGSFTIAGGLNCPCSIWNDSTTPAQVEANDPQAVELGVKFQSNLDGFITGIRFFKGVSNTGTHVGTLWNSAGQELASVTFTNETASGWQQASFSNPVPIAANTTLIASYHTDVGFYSVNNDAFVTAGVNNPPLRVLQEGEDGGNGVFKYGARAFPIDTFRSSNYWADVVFTTQ